jgi:hypothetical protein
MSIAQNEPLNLVLEATNLPLMEPEYDNTLIRIKIGSRDWKPVDKIVSSTRERTIFAYSTSGPWTPGAMTVSFCSVEVRNCEDLALFNVTIVKDIAPLVENVFPQKVYAHEESSITANILYMDPATTIEDLFLKLIIPSNTSQLITAISLTSLAPSSCLFSECSNFNIVFKVPVNPAGMDKATEAFVIISALGKEVNATFRYKPSGQPVVELLEPQTAVLTSAEHLPVTIFLRNFPSAGCKHKSCSEEAYNGNMKVLFDDVPGTIVPGSLENVGELLRFSVIPPSLTTAHAALCCIQASDEEANDVSVDFNFTYTLPAPQLTPSNGITTGHTPVSLRVLGVQKLVLAQDLILTLCSQPVSQFTVVDAAFAGGRLPFITVTFNSPKCSAGVSEGTLAAADGSASASFSFTYFTAPQISSAIPNMITVDGRTSEGLTTVLRVAGLPATTSAGITVEIAGIQCDLFAACTIVQIVNTLHYVEVTVKVPPAAEGEQQIRVTSGERTALSTLTYYQPHMEIRSVRWCSTCNSRFCISNGICTSTMTEPRENAAPTSGKGYVVLVVDNMPVVSFDEQGKSVVIPK